MPEARQVALCAGLVLLAQAATAEVKNITLYRITPRNYTGIRDLDTGDAAGDAFFGLYEKSEPISCGKNHFSMSNLLCENDPLLQIPGFNVYIQVQVEVDTRFGHYAECNPTKTPPHDFECTHHGGESCWYSNDDHPEWAQEFAGVCSKLECYCKAVETESVGQEYPHFGASIPPGTPESCASTFYPFANASFADWVPVAKQFQGSLGDCCSTCAAQNTVELGCAGYAFISEGDENDTNNGTCKHYKEVSFSGFKRGEGNYLGFSTGVGLGAYVQRAVGDFSDQMNGAWYSTQSPGECTKPTDVIGKDCWWRLVEQTAQVNASCVNDHMINTVINHRPSCFEGCPQPKNQTSDCFIACLFETLAGNTSKTPAIPPMQKSDIIDAFQAGFTGAVCEAVPDCPEPCRPPCWGVPEGAPCDNTTKSWY